MMNRRAIGRRTDPAFRSSRVTIGSAASEKLMLGSPGHTHESPIDDGVPSPASRQIEAETQRPIERVVTGARHRIPRPTIDDLLANQRRQSERLSELDRTVRHLRRRMLAGGGLIGLLLISLLALGVFAYGDPERSAFLGAQANAASDSAAPDPAFDRLTVPEEMVMEWETEFKIRSDVDRKYQLLVRELYNRARTFRLPRGPIEVRNTETDDYIRFRAELSSVIERAAADRPSIEILLALINVAAVSKELRKVERSSDLDADTRNKMDQINLVLRARDVRPNKGETSPLGHDRR